MPATYGTRDVYTEKHNAAVHDEHHTLCLCLLRLVCLKTKQYGIHFTEETNQWNVWRKWRHSLLLLFLEPWSEEGRHPADEPAQVLHVRGHGQPDLPQRGVHPLQPACEIRAHAHLRKWMPIDQTRCDVTRCAGRVCGCCCCWVGFLLLRCSPQFAAVDVARLEIAECFVHILLAPAARTHYARTHTALLPRSARMRHHAPDGWRHKARHVTARTFLSLLMFIRRRGFLSFFRFFIASPSFADVLRYFFLLSDFLEAHCLLLARRLTSVTK